MAKKEKKVKGAKAITEKQIAEAREPEIKDVSEIYKNGCLLSLRIGFWSANSNLGSDVIKDEFTEEDKKLIRAKNRLLEDDSLLKEVLSVRMAARLEVRRWSIDFPVPMLRYIKKEHIPKINVYLLEQEKEFWNKVDQFTEALFKSGGLMDNFRDKHPKLYEKALVKGGYPRTPDEAKRKFSFIFTWRKLDLPDANGDGIFTPEMMQEEIQKAKAEISEMKAMTMQMVRETLLKRISTLQEQCEEDKVNKRTVNAWNDWLNKFDSLWSDFVWRDDLRNVVDQVRKTMTVDADNLKEDEKFRNRMGKELGKVVKELQNLPEIKSARAFDL